MRTKEKAEIFTGNSCMGREPALSTVAIQVLPSWFAIKGAGIAMGRCASEIITHGERRGSAVHVRRPAERMKIPEAVGIHGFGDLLAYQTRQELTGYMG
jgi:hypothetical protein